MTDVGTHGAPTTDILRVAEGNFLMEISKPAADKVSIIGPDETIAVWIDDVLCAAGIPTCPALDHDSIRPVVAFAGADRDLAAMQALVLRYPGATVIAVVSGDAGPPFHRSCVVAGAAAVVTHVDAAAVLAGVVDMAIAGDGVLPKLELFELALHASGNHRGDSELAWIAAMAGGLSIEDVAAEVGYSRRHFYRLLSQLYDRLGVNGSSEAIAVIKRLGVPGRDVGDGS